MVEEHAVSRAVEGQEAKRMSSGKGMGDKVLSFQGISTVTPIPTTSPTSQ